MYSLFWQDAGKVALYSVLFGAGLPVIYALGVRFLAVGSVTGGSGERVGRNPVGLLLAALCFVAVGAAVALGIAYVLAAGKGEQLSFTHVYPTFAPKS